MLSYGGFVATAVTQDADGTYTVTAEDISYGGQ